MEEQAQEKRQIGLSFGILSDSISKQLTAQKFIFDKKIIKNFEDEVDAINTLRFGSGLLTDSMIDKIISKLYKKIVQHVAKKNKLSAVNIKK